MGKVELNVPQYRLELVRERYIEYRSVGKTEAAAEVLHEMLDRSPTEQMVVLYLDSNAKMFGAEKVSMGTLESVMTVSGELFRGALVAAAPHIIISHNHPHGDPNPSDPDIRFTVSAIAIGEILGVRVRDHIIVSPNGKHYSLFDRQREISDRMQKAQMDLLLNGLGLNKKF